MIDLMGSVLWAGLKFINQWHRQVNTFLKLSSMSISHISIFMKIGTQKSFRVEVSLHVKIIRPFRMDIRFIFKTNPKTINKIHTTITILICTGYMSHPTETKAMNIYPMTSKNPRLQKNPINMSLILNGLTTLHHITYHQSKAQLSKSTRHNRHQISLNPTYLKLLLIVINTIPRSLLTLIMYLILTWEGQV